MRVVLDTNAILASVSLNSPYKIIREAVQFGEIELFVTTEILLEYEEKLTEIFNQQVADFYFNGLRNAPKVRYIETSFRLQLISADMDDNKFVDCAFAANAHYLVTNDKHYNILKNLPFPKLNVIRIEAFAELLKTAIL